MNYSIEEWQRECRTSLVRAQARRVNPHPWPRGSAILPAIAFAIVGAAVIWLFLVFVFAIAPTP